MSAHALFAIVYRTRNHRCGRRISGGEKDVITHKFNSGPRFFVERAELQPRRTKGSPAQSPDVLRTRAVRASAAIMVR
jgi:hypothetical protein